MSEDAAHTFGSPLLAELRRRLRSTAGFTFSAVQALEVADRQEVGKILRREITGLTYAQNEMIERESPQVIANWLIDEIRRRDDGTAAAFLFS